MFAKAELRKATVLAIAAFAAVTLPLFLAKATGTEMAVLWPMTGLEVFAFALYGWGVALPLWLGYIVAGLVLSTYSPAAVLLLSAFEVVLSGVIVVVWRRWGFYRGTLEDLKAIVGLIVVYSIAMAVLEPIAMARHILLGMPESLDGSVWLWRLRTYWDLWLSSVALVLISAPLFLATREYWHRRSGRRAGLQLREGAELLVLLAGLAGMAFLIVRAGNFSVGPVGSVQYTYIGSNAVTEKGAGSLNLRVDRQREHS